MQKHTFARFNFRPNAIMGRSLDRILMEGEPAAVAPVVAPRVESFPREYVIDLREENKGWRTKHGELETANKTATARIAELEKANGETQTKAQQEADARVLRAELKYIAREHGVADVNDALKVLDLSTVKFDADGNVVGATELFEAAKKAKPYLFKEVTTSNTKKTPEPNKNEPVDVRKQTDEEYAASKAAYLASTRKR